MGAPGVLLGVAEFSILFLFFFFFWGGGCLIFLIFLGVER